ncbi:MAG: SDR family oxidoreductase [Deinococcota bacterium]
MKVLIIGSTGKTGQELIRQALEQGHTVTAFARTPSKLSTFSNVNVVQGDVLDPATLERAIPGQDVVISALGTADGEPVGTVCSDGTRNILSLMQTHGVTRYIAVSTIGIEETKPRMDFLSRFLVPKIIGKERLDEAQRQEDITQASDVRWTLVRPARLTDDKPKGSVQAAPDLPTKFMSSLSRADLARFLLEQIDNSSYVNNAVTVIN